MRSREQALTTSAALTETGGPGVNLAARVAIGTLVLVGAGLSFGYFSYRRAMAVADDAWTRICASSHCRIWFPLLRFGAPIEGSP